MGGSKNIAGCFIFFHGTIPLKNWMITVGARTLAMVAGGTWWMPTGLLGMRCTPFHHKFFINHSEDGRFL